LFLDWLFPAPILSSTRSEEGGGIPKPISNCCLLGFVERLWMDGKTRSFDMSDKEEETVGWGEGVDSVVTVLRR